MRWSNWIKKIPKFFKSIIAVPLSLFSKRSSREADLEDDDDEYEDDEYEDNAQVVDSTDDLTINNEPGAAHKLSWYKRIPVTVKNIITAPLSLFSKRSSNGPSKEEDDNIRDLGAPDITLINPEKLAVELASHLPNQHSSKEKKAEIQELKNTIERLRQDTANESKKAALQELSKDEVTKATDLLKKSAQSQAKQSEYPSTDAALDCIDIGNIIFLQSPQKALASFRKAVKLDPLNIDAWHRLSRISYWSGNLNESRKAYEQFLKLAGEDKPLQAIGYGNLGTIYKNSGQLDKAEESYLKSLEINEALDQQEDMAFANGNLGIIYYTLGEYDKAEEFYLKSLEINETLDRQEGMAIQYCNLGILYKKRGELDKAEEFHLKSLEINKSLEQKRGMAADYGNLGNIYKIHGELDKAEEFHLKSLGINKSLEQKKGMASDYGNLGNVYKIRGELDKACDYWKKGLELFSNIKAKEQISQTKKLIADSGKTDS